MYVLDFHPTNPSYLTYIKIIKLAFEKLKREKQYKTIYRIRKQFT